jgi:hypothetical protein
MGGPTGKPYCGCMSSTYRKAGAHPLVVARIERLDAAHTARDPGVLWVGWQGAEPSPLATWWDWYLRRFAVDHWHRFAKQGLHWTLPQLATPAQAEHWRDLLPLLTWQLWLARTLVNDVRLPWQKPQPAGHKTPGAPRHGGTFGRDWPTGSAAETPRKSARVADRARAQAP